MFDNDGVLDTVERLRDDAAKCADASLWVLSDTDLVTAADEVHRLEQTIAAVKLHLIAEIDARDIPAAQQVRGTVSWLRLRLLLDAATARRLVDQAAALARHPAVDAALCAGTIHLRQADAITDALDALPTSTELAALPAGSAPPPPGPSMRTRLLAAKSRTPPMARRRPARRSRSPVRPIRPAR